MKGLSSSLSLRERAGGLDVRDAARPVAALVVYGGALGAARLLVSLMAQTRYPALPEHASLYPSLFLGGAAFLAGAGLSRLFAYWLGRRAGRMRDLVVFVVLGFGYGVLLPFATGMLLPWSIVFLNLKTGLIHPGEVFSGVLDAVFRVPYSAFSHGTLGLYTAMLAGLLFGVGAWAIDTTNASANTGVSRYGSAFVALSLSAGVVAVAAFAPASFLANLG